MNKVPQPISDQPGSRAQAKARPVSWLGNVGWRLLGRWGARVGLAWIAILLICAVFAPFLASSYPLWWRTPEGASSPLLAHLTPVDAVLLAAFSLAVLMCGVRAAPPSGRLMAWIWFTLVAIPLCAWRKWGDAATRLTPLVSGTPWTEGEKETVVFWGVSIAAVLALLLLLVALPLWMRVSRRFKGWMFAGLIVVGLPLAAVAPNPSEKEDFSYRMAQAQNPEIGAVFAPVPYSPGDRQRELNRNVSNLAPTGEHWLGTDENGADVASVMLHACRIAMAIGFIATGIALVLGIVIGGAMGYFSGRIDLLGMRLVEIFAAIPTLPILIMICAFYGRNIYLMMIIIGLFGWVGYAVFIRAEFLRLRKSDFVQAAQAVGASTGRILLRHMLPNGITPVLTMASFGVAGAILTESVLSFLGLGLSPGDPSWGQLLNMAYKGSGLQWWLVVFPGIAIFLTVFAYNLVGEALRDALDPKLNK